MTSADGWGDDVYQPDSSDIQDDAGLLDAEDTLEDDGVEDPLDRGWSPPDRPWAVEHAGVTAAERHQGESLEQRLTEEVRSSPGRTATVSVTATAPTGNSSTTRSAPHAPAGSWHRTRGFTRTRKAP